MRSTFSKIALTVSFLLAIIFTFSCSAMDDSIGDSSSSSGGGVQKCGGVVYDADTYRCEAGELIGKCKGVDYYPAYQQCVSGVVLDGSPSSSSSGGSSSSGSNATSTYSLDGIWEGESGGLTTISGSGGVRSAFGSPISAPMQDAINKGYVTLGQQTYRNLTSTGTLTWSGQVFITYGSNENPNVALGTEWFNCTITMSADGQTITIVRGSKIIGNLNIREDTSTLTRKQ
jgi:hypothetical protein